MERIFLQESRAQMAYNVKKISHLYCEELSSNSYYK